MNHLGKISNIACQIVWRIPDQVLKMRVGRPNFIDIFCRSWLSSHPRCARAFELRELDGRSVREAARTLGLADGTVKAQLSRGRAKLTRLMRRALRPKTHSVLVVLDRPPWLESAIGRLPSIS